jgi:hypothetical protein
MPDDPPTPSPTERLLRSLGNHLSLIATHAEHMRRQLAELAGIIEGPPR